jgi:hypothetical protein
MECAMSQEEVHECKMGHSSDKARVTARNSGSWNIKGAVKGQDLRPWRTRVALMRPLLRSHNPALASSLNSTTTMHARVPPRPTASAPTGGPTRQTAVRRGAAPPHDTPAMHRGRSTSRRREHTSGSVRGEGPLQRVAQEGDRHELAMQLRAAMCW